mmetsp:Transcript_106760/g.195653  ORF Transcript_106760/g.195653 Transcript_106760/m.195653 type:complete len:98 (+) Transcript_106760:1433-1726(+)
MEQVERVRDLANVDDRPITESCVETRARCAACGDEAESSADGGQDHRQRVGHAVRAEKKTAPHEDKGKNLKYKNSYISSKRSKLAVCSCAGGQHLKQ